MFFSAPTITAVLFLLLLLFTLIYFLNSFKACGHVNTCIHQAYPELIYADYAMVYKKEEEEESQTNRKRSKGKNIQTKLHAYIHNNNSNNRKVFKKKKNPATTAVMTTYKREKEWDNNSSSKWDKKNKRKKRAGGGGGGGEGGLHRWSTPLFTSNLNPNTLCPCSGYHTANRRC